MIYTDFKGVALSQLGFGAMRLPLRNRNNPADIDEEQVEEMINYAYNHGVNYFDTAWPYHFGRSETVLCKYLKQYPRDNYFIATKYPGHQIANSYRPAEIFEKQLEKCGVDYFDFYLLHNIYTGSLSTYFDERWNIVDYFVEQKKLGKIRYLGFSTHGNIPIITQFLERYGDIMEFCQIQLNYIDWTLQDAKSKCELLDEYGIPIWVMEPVRGGALAQLNETNEALLKNVRPNDSAVSWAFRWIQQIPNVKVILSGMSNISQVIENVDIFDNMSPLTNYENRILNDIAESMKNNIPCTKCGYCISECPQELAIPELLGHFNDIRFAPGLTPVMAIEGMHEDKKPQSCIECGACAKICPQGINIPNELKKLSETLSKLPSWAQICAERDAKS